MKNISRTFVIFITLVITVFLMYYFIDLVFYVFVAWILSMIGQPFMIFFQKMKIGKIKIGSTFAAVLTLLTFFIILFGLIAIFVPLIVEQARNISGVDFNSVIATLNEPISEVERWMQEIGLIETLEGSPFRNTNINKKFDPTQLTNLLSTIISTAGNLLIGLFSIVFITFFFLRENGLFLNLVLAITPSRYIGHVKNTIEEASRLLARYFAGILMQITIITIVISSALALLGIKNALLIGFFAALINVIPYLGPIFGAAFGVFIAISSNLNVDFYSLLLPMIVKILIVFSFMQILDNFILQPLIFSNSVMAHPLEIFFVILIGSKLGGIGGMIVAIPVYTIIRVIARVFLSEFKVVQQLTQNIMPDK